MEKAFAYICADAEATPRLLRRYCRKVYELGYVPICPKLSEVQYLQPDNPDEKRDFHSISHQKLGRCRMLVVCGSEISNSILWHRHSPPMSFHLLLKNERTHYFREQISTQCRHQDFLLT